MTKLPTDAKVELVRKLREVGKQGYTVRGQKCAGDLMLEAADALEQSDAEQGEAQGMGVPATPSGHSRAEPEVSALRASVPNALYPCGHPRTRENSYAEYRQVGGSSNFKCRECSLQRGRGRRAKRRADRPLKGMNPTIKRDRAIIAPVSAAELAAAHALAKSENIPLAEMVRELLASAIEARRAETLGSVEDESAVAKPDAHTPQVDKG